MFLAKKYKRKDLILSQLVNDPWLKSNSHLLLGGLGLKPIYISTMVPRKYHNASYFSMNLKSTLVISKSKGPSETLRDIRTLT